MLGTIVTRRALPGSNTDRSVRDESDTIPVFCRWWFCVDPATLARITFLPDLSCVNEVTITVGMRAVWGTWSSETMELYADPSSGEFFRRERTPDGRIYGRVFAPAPPLIGFWSAEPPQSLTELES